MTIREIIQEKMDELGYDGIIKIDGNETCGCNYGEIAPCGGDPLDCELGYMTFCDICGDHYPEAEKNCTLRDSDFSMYLVTKEKCAGRLASDARRAELRIKYEEFLKGNGSMVEKHKCSFCKKEFTSSQVYIYKYFSGVRKTVICSNCFAVGLEAFTPNRMLKGFYR